MKTIYSTMTYQPIDFGASEFKPGYIPYIIDTEFKRDESQDAAIELAIQKATNEFGRAFRALSKSEKLVGSDEPVRADGKLQPLSSGNRRIPRDKLADWIAGKYDPTAGEVPADEQSGAMGFEWNRPVRVLNHVRERKRKTG